jgi:hypothetical protein
MAAQHNSSHCHTAIGAEFLGEIGLKHPQDFAASWVATRKLHGYFPLQLR